MTFPLPSSASYMRMCLPGDGKYGVSERCDECPEAENCEGVQDASKAPLCELPPYVASRYPEVRKAAKARFIELQEEKEDAAMLEDWPGLVGIIDTVSLKSDSNVWAWGHPGPLVSKLVAEVLEAPLDNLPRYMTSRFPRVRKAAKTRFIELRA